MRSSGATNLDCLSVAGGSVARTIPLKLDDVLFLDRRVACDALLARHDNLVDACLANNVAANLMKCSGQDSADSPAATR